MTYVLISNRHRRVRNRYWYNCQVTFNYRCIIPRQNSIKTSFDFLLLKMISQLTACARLWPYSFPGQDRKSEFSAPPKTPPPKNLHQRILCACIFKTALSDRVLHFCRYKLGKRSFLRFHYANKRGRVGQTTETCLRCKFTGLYVY